MTAIVTGGGSGIGAATVERLRKAGHHVTAWDIRGGDITCDISDPESVTAALEQTVAVHGVPARLVACAGVGASGMLLDQDPADWRRVIDTNLTGTWLTMRAAGPGHDRSGYRRIDRRGIEHQWDGRGSRHGRVLRVKSRGGHAGPRRRGRMGQHGIRVNAVGPGVTRTPMLAKPEQLPGWVDGLTERTALGRLGEADDVAETIVAMLEMSWVTGQTVFSDGGLALHSPIDAYGQVQRISRA